MEAMQNSQAIMTKTNNNKYNHKYNFMRQVSVQYIAILLFLFIDVIFVELQRNVKGI